MALTLIVTNAGRAALVNAAHNGTAPVLIAQAGVSATTIAPDPAAVSLPGESKRLATLSGAVVAPDTIHLTVRDESADIFTVRSLALYLADGTLFALYGQADPILEKSAQSMMLLAVDIRFADIDAASLSFGDANFLNPPATTEIQGVVELATTAEAQAGTDALRALTPGAAKAAILGWLLAQDGAGSGLDADLLDGRDGSWYADIAARLGFTPVNKAGDTMTGPLALPGNPATGLQAAPKQYIDALVTAAALLARLVTVDGSGSGLDADLLDGREGDWYAGLANAALNAANAKVSKSGDLMTGALSLTPGNVVSINAGNGIGGIQMVGGDAGHSGYINLYDQNNVRVGYMGFATAGGALAYSNDQGGGHAFAGGQLGRDGNRVWDAGNDGAGSGLDADLWRGMSPEGLFAWYAGENGFIIYPNGYAEVWGFVASNPVSNSASSFSYPLTFTGGIFGIPLLTPAVDTGNSPIAWISKAESGNSGFAMRCTVANIGVAYVARGKI